MNTPAFKVMHKSYKLFFAGVLCVLLFAVGGLIFFNAYVYTGYKLGGYTKQEYQKALDIAARDFCRADNLTFIGFEEILHGGDTDAWAAVRAKDEVGRTVYVWIYLEWGSCRQQWLRKFCRRLAPPMDELFYNRITPTQIKRAQYAISQMIADVDRNFRVVFGDTK